MVRFFLIFFAATAAIYASLMSTNGLLEPIYKETLSAFFVIATLFAALSFALYTYIEGISKDLPDRSKVKNGDKLDAAIAALQKLRKEVISNVSLVVGMVLFERIIYGIAEIIAHEGWQTSSDLKWLLLSARSSCLIVTLVASFTQFHGFLIATEFRSILSKYKS